MKKQRRLIRIVVLAFLWLAIIAGLTLGAMTYFNPFMLNAIIDIQFGASQPISSRINSWRKLEDRFGKTISSETKSDWMNSLGYTYQNEVQHTGEDINRLVIAKWCFEQSLLFAEDMEPSTKRNNQISFARGSLKALKTTIQKYPSLSQVEQQPIAPIQSTFQK